MSEPDAPAVQPDVVAQPHAEVESAMDADTASAAGGTRDAELVEEAVENLGHPDARTLFQREAERTRGQAG